MFFVDKLQEHYLDQASSNVHKFVIMHFCTCNYRVSGFEFINKTEKPIHVTKITLTYTFRTKNTIM